MADIIESLAGNKMLMLKEDIAFLRKRLAECADEDAKKAIRRELMEKRLIIIFSQTASGLISKPEILPAFSVFMRLNPAGRNNKIKISKFNLASHIQEEYFGKANC